MENPEDVVICGICRNPNPRGFCHEHHIVPKAAEGPNIDENLLTLCASCHNNLHRICDMLKAGKSLEAESIASVIYQNPKIRSLMLRLASQAVRSILLNRSQATGGDIVLKVKIPRQDVLRLNVLANEINFGGRPCSVQRYIRELVLKTLREGYKL